MDVTRSYGVYAIICNITGAVYIGSSINIGNRLVDHLVVDPKDLQLKKKK